MKKHKLIGLSLVLLSLVFVCMSAALPTDTRNFNSSPRTVPLLVSSVMLVFSVAYAFLQSFSIETIVIHRASVFRVSLLLAAIPVYILFLEKLGYIFSTFALAAIASMIVGIRGYGKALLFSLSLSLGTWLLFAKVFSAYLPGSGIF